VLGPRAVARKNGLDESAGERREDVGAESRERAELERKRQHPLAHGHRGNDPVDQVRRGVGHPASGAARAYAAVLARERHEQVVPAVLTARADEAVSENAAAEVGAKLVLHVARHGRLVAVAGVREKRLQVPVYDAVEHCLGWAARPVRGCKDGHDLGRGLIAACQRGARAVARSCEPPPMSGSVSGVAGDSPRWPPGAQSAFAHIDRRRLGEPYARHERARSVTALEPVAGAVVVRLRAGSRGQARRACPSSKAGTVSRWHWRQEGATVR
jgi:hypothetical protein